MGIYYVCILRVHRVSSSSLHIASPLIVIVIAVSARGAPAQYADAAHTNGILEIRGK